MNQARLDRRVARATGESLRTIRQRGFSIVNQLSVYDEPEPEADALPNVVDWDDDSARRTTSYPARRERQLVAA